MPTCCLPRRETAALGGLLDLPAPALVGIVTALRGTRGRRRGGCRGRGVRRAVGGGSLLPCSDGHCFAALAVWVARRRSIASRLSRRPVRVGNSGSCRRPAR